MKTKILASLLLCLSSALLASGATAQGLGGGGANGGQLLGAQISQPAKPYIGEVATRAKLNDFYNASYTQVMARSMHRARQDLSVFRILLFHGYNSPTNGEQVPPGATTFTASIEYPAGVFKQVTFGGSTSVVRSDGKLSTSDPISVAIPDGATFWVRIYEQDPSGVVFDYASPGYYSPVDVLALGTAAAPISDMTMGGTVPNNVGNATLAPAAIIAPTVRDAACLVGDSRFVGIADGVDDSSGNRGEAARFVGPRAAYINLSIQAGTTAGVLKNNANRLSLMNDCSFMIDNLGINELDSATALAARRAAVASLFHTGKVYGTTLVVNTTSSDSFATAANQKTASTEAVRIAFNALVRAGIAGEAGFIDLDYAIDPLATGKWPTNGSANWATTDGLHENNPAARMEVLGSVWQKVSLGR